MKARYLLLFIPILILLSTENADAQIWKKLKNKTKQKVEDRITDKISDKVAEAIVGKMTERFDLESNPYRGGFKISKPENLPDEYNFDWNYQLKISNTTNKSEDLVFDYWLSTDNNYFGYSMPQSTEMFSVVDPNNEAIVSYFEEDGNSFAMSYSYPVSTVNENSNMEGSSENVEITELPGKMILGYNAKGYQIDTDESQMIIYVTSEVEVAFSDMGGLKNQGVPTAFSSNLDETKNTLMLYSKFTNKNNPESVTEMECVLLEKNSRSKNNKDYNFL